MTQTDYKHRERERVKMYTLECCTNLASYGARILHCIRRCGIAVLYTLPVVCVCGGGGGDCFLYLMR